MPGCFCTGMCRTLGYCPNGGLGWYPPQPQVYVTGTISVVATSCAKCCGTDIHTSYHRGSGYSKGCGYSSHSKQDGPHLHFHCRTCGWDWTGPTADAPADADSRDTRGGG